MGLLVAASLAGLASAAPNPSGNNGTIKIDDTPFDDHPNNEPHVGCVFQVDFYGYDEADLDASETYTLDFTGIEPHPNQGFHVKLTINAEGSQGADVKHKVFWVTGCAPTTTNGATSTSGATTTIAPTTTVAPTTTIAPTTTVAPTTTIAPTTTVAPHHDHEADHQHGRADQLHRRQHDLHHRAVPVHDQALTPSPGRGGPSPVAPARRAQSGTSPGARR
jgi:hypothetical protein